MDDSEDYYTVRAYKEMMKAIREQELAPVILPSGGGELGMNGTTNMGGQLEVKFIPGPGREIEHMGYSEE